MAHLPENPTLDELNEFFARDRFATEAGCRIVEGAAGRAVCELVLEDRHRNAMGNVMGGAVFTVADFALAVASNVGQPPSVSVNSSIDFLGAAKGERLIATCEADKLGRRLGFFTVKVTDDTGRPVARMTATVCRVGE